MANNRIFWAIKALGIAPLGSTVYTEVHGLQTVGITTTTFSPLMPSVPTGRYLSGDIMLLAEYYAVNGDSRLKDAVMGNVSQYITEHSLNIDDICFFNRFKFLYS